MVCGKPSQIVLQGLGHEIAEAPARPGSSLAGHCRSTFCFRRPHGVLDRELEIRSTPSQRSDMSDGSGSHVRIVGMFAGVGSGKIDFAFEIPICCSAGF